MTEDQGQPISYQAVQPGTPILTRAGRQFGTLVEVLEIPSEDLFDGVIVETAQGHRFVDRDQIGQITTTRIACHLDDAAVEALPEPSGTPTFHADAGQDAGHTLKDWFGRTFGKRGWKRDRNS